jgi:hypothetical protein
VIHAEQSGELDLRVDLLHAFAHRGPGGVLVVVDKPAGQAPEAIARLDASPAEHDAATVLDHHRGGDLRVVPQNIRIVRTNLELSAFDCLHAQRRAALDAEMAHRGGD